MKFFKKFREVPEWKKFEAANSKSDNSLVSYSKSLKTAFSDNFGKMSKSLYPFDVDPFFHFQSQMILLSTELRDKVKLSLSSNGCLNNLKQIRNGFSTYKAEYELALQQEKQASQEFQQTSKAISTIQNQNDFRKADLENQSAFSKDKECTKEANKAQVEFDSRFNEYQKKFCEIILSNLEVEYNSQKKLAQQFSSISSNLLALSQSQIRFPQIARESIDYEKLKKKIQKHKNEIQKQDKIEKEVKNVD